MLVDFTVENYRSIKEPVTLSAVAQKQSARQKSQNSKRTRVKLDHEITPGYHIEGWDIDILPVLAIFGANASGKSNVIQALDYLLLMMTYGLQEILTNHKKFKYTKLDPFKLDNLSENQPTKFELRTVFGNDIYTYSLVINQKRVILEKLDYVISKTKRTRRLFSRKWDEESQKNIWKTGDDFSGPHNQLQKSIRENDLFISTLIKLKIERIEPLLHWLRERWPGDIHLEYEQIDFGLVTLLHNDNFSTFKEMLKQILEIVKKFDIGLSDIKIEKKSDEYLDFNISAIHKKADGQTIIWPLEEESLGTQKLLGFASRIVVARTTGGLLIVDELGNNLHPNIIKNIIKTFQNPKTNPKNAQLIFTSHDNTLQRNNLLRRDQIWFTQKLPDQSTDLYPLTDFNVRNDLAIDKAYLDGRFGAVPFLPSSEEMILQGDEQCQDS